MGTARSAPVGHTHTLYYTGRSDYIFFFRANNEDVTKSRSLRTLRTLIRFRRGFIRDNPRTIREHNDGRRVRYCICGMRRVLLYIITHNLPVGFKPVVP